RVVGLADSMHLDKAVPRNPINRRISIIVLNHRTQQQIERENGGDPASSRTGRLPFSPLPTDNVKVTAVKPLSPVTP
ncbi:MAG: flagellar motor protein MotB, partial [Variovorax sp.]